MGSWTSFKVDGYSIFSTKSYADPETLSLFREADKHVRIRALVANVPCLSPWLPLAQAESAVRELPDGRLTVTLPAGAKWELSEDELDECETDCSSVPSGDAIIEAGHVLSGHSYMAPVTQVRERLDAMGFTLGATERIFSEYATGELAAIEAQLEEEGDPYGFAERDREALTNLTFAAWLTAFRWIKERGAHSIDSNASHREDSWRGYWIQPQEATPIVRFLLDDNADHHYGFPYDDVRFLYRAALEICPGDGVVMLDLSEVTAAGYYTEFQQVVAEARAGQIAQFPANSPTIVLTEGPTDQRALHGALRLLYPHLDDLYSFMDFEAMRVRGGAAALAAMVKSFAGAGVANRVLALFDNDTAAHSALKDLRTIELPANVRVLVYPRLALASNYPTIGPTGEHLSDVNGSAASLEMYFGEDVLRDDTGALSPVQWGSVDWGLQRYQGELRDKARVQSRFNEKLAAALVDPTLIESQDWSGMRAILDEVRTAFY